MCSSDLVFGLNQLPAVLYSEVAATMDEYKNSIKTYQEWEKSNLNISDYLPFPCEIDEVLANHISESTFPHYNTGEFTQGLDPEFSRNSYDDSPEKEVFFYTSFSQINGRFFYLGVLPEFRY